MTREADSVKIEANNASAEELLAALNETLGLEYRSTADLSASISGTFEGPLPEVLSRVLRGYNYSLSTSANGSRLAVYDLKPGHGGRAALASKSPVELSPGPQRPDDTKRMRRDLGQEDGGPLPIRRMKHALAARGAPHARKTAP
ncbi:MAG: hypothetical protein L0Y57_07970 [Beijerinckiaceae bacterium]|nr:hypothetical protein [Beijerinckiaceae bacterium]